jgi:hypothetical protein
MNRNARRLILLAAAAAAASGAQAQAYKCMDAGGKTYYSERPCKGQQGLVEKGTVKAPPPRPADAPPHATANKPTPAASKSQTPAAAPGQPADSIRRDKRGNPET